MAGEARQILLCFGQQKQSNTAHIPNGSGCPLSFGEH
jgi:hypothetical protein